MRAEWSHTAPSSIPGTFLDPRSGEQGNWRTPGGSRAKLTVYLPPAQGSPIVSRDTGRCLEVEMSGEANFGLRLVVQRCSGQKWTIRNWVTNPQP